MPYKFSQTTGVFYPDHITYPEGAIPDDAIDASDEEFDLAMTRDPQATLGVVDGAVAVLAYSGPTLAEAQAAQIAMLSDAFRAAAAAPVRFTNAAGVAASFPQSDEAKSNLGKFILAGASAWTLNLWIDVNNRPISPFTFADLQGLDAAMRAVDVPTYPDFLVKIGEVSAATSIEAVRAVTF